jgi:nicotinamide phosphoribosyltransferase
LYACVSDSYNIYDACEKLWGTELKKEIENSGGLLVVRPDSGDPTRVVTKVLNILDSKFGSTYNTKGFKVLNHVRVIQGDGVNEEAIRGILAAALSNGFSATNLAFGMGGALLQKVDRDTQKFAYKCSEITVNGKYIPVFKDPVDDAGKKSKSGRLELIHEGGQYKTVSGPGFGNLLKPVFENGRMLREYTLAEVRKNASL